MENQTKITNNGKVHNPNIDNMDDIIMKESKQLPVAYIYWLTCRSKYVDYLVETGVVKESHVQQFVMNEVKKCKEEENLID